MDEVQQMYREALGSRIEALEAARRSLQEGDPEARESIMRIAHTLKGSGGTYGFQEISDAAEDVGTVDDDLFVESLSTLLAILHQVSIGG